MKCVITGGCDDSISCSGNPKDDLCQTRSLSQVLATIFQGRSVWLDRRWRDPPSISRCACLVRYPDMAHQLLHSLATPHRHVRVEGRRRGAGEAQSPAFGSDHEQAAAARLERVRSSRRRCHGAAPDASELLSKCRVGRARLRSYPVGIRMHQ